MHPETAAGASAMTAACTDTNCSTRTANLSLQRHQSQTITAGTTAISQIGSESTWQHLLQTVRQTAEVASQIRRHRDALATQQPAKQLSASDSTVQQLLVQSLQQNPQSQPLPQLQDMLVQLLAQEAASSAAPLPSLLAALLPTRSQQPEAPSCSPAALRRLQHVTSLADSSLAEAAAADALLDLELGSRDSHSFSQTRVTAGQAAAAAAASVRPDSAAGGLATPEAAEAAPSTHAPGTTQQGSGATAADLLGRGSLTAGAAAGASPAPGDGDGAHSTSIGSGAASFSQQQQELLSLLAKHMATLQAAAGKDAATPQTLPAAADPGQGAADQGPAGRRPSETSGGVAAVPQFPQSPTKAVSSAAGASLDPTKVQLLVGELRRQLTCRQLAQAAAAAPADPPPAAAAAASAVHRPLLQRSSTVAGAPSAGTAPAALSSGLSGGSGGMERHQSVLGSLLRCASTISNCAAAGSGAAAAAAASVHGQQSSGQQQAAGAAADGTHGSGHPDTELLQMYGEFQSNRKQVLALIQEAAKRGLLPSRVSHRLQQQQRQHRATESPTITLTAVSAGAAAATFSGGTTGPAVLSKRTRDQTEGATEGADAADADAPSSKLRRLEHNSSKAAAPAAATEDAAKPEAAADAVEPMDTSAAADSSQQRPEDVKPAARLEASEDQDSNEQAAGASAENPAPAAPAPAPPAAAAEPQARASSPQHPVQAADEAAAAGADTPALTDMVGRAVEVVLLVHGLSKRVLGKAVTLKKETLDANSRADQVAALASSNTSQMQQLQLQNKLLQQQVRVVEAELQAKQQQLRQVQVRAQHAVVAYPQLIARVTNSVNRLVAAASQDSLPVGDRQELARISQELLAACGQLRTL